MSLCFQAAGSKQIKWQYIAAAFRCLRPMGFTLLPGVEYDSVSSHMVY